MQVWFVFALLSAIFWGVEQFLHKLSAARKLNTSSVTLIYSITSCLVSLFVFLLFQRTFTNLTLLFLVGILNAAMVFIGFVSRINALKHIPGSIFFPINKTGILMVMIFVSLIFLQEPLSIFQMIGLVLALISIFLLTWNNQKGIKSKLSSLGITLTVLSTVSFAVANVISNYASSRFSAYEYIFAAYFFVLIISLTHRMITSKERLKISSIGKNEFRLGFFIGVFNVAGYISFFLALQRGLFSIVGALNNFSLLITIALLYFVLKEKPTVIQGVGISIAFISLFLLR